MTKFTLRGPPIAHRNLLAIVELTGAVDQAVHWVGLNEVTADVAFAELARASRKYNAIGEKAARFQAVNGRRIYFPANGHV